MGSMYISAGLPKYFTRDIREQRNFRDCGKNSRMGKESPLLCYSTPYRLDSRNQGRKRKNSAPKALVNSYTQRAQQGED